jgi:hypothetical protein
LHSRNNRLHDRIAAVNDDHAQLRELLADRAWRLSNLYWILDKAGQKILFVPNAAQRRLLNDLHYLNLILKARQLGFSTLIQMLTLDACLFTDNVQAGVVAHTLDDAQAIFEGKLKFAYDNLPEWLRAERPAVSDRAGELAFANGSRIRVATSLRSGTTQILHISEYGKICRKYPDRAREVKSGTLQTLAAGNFGFIESTAEGRSGDYFNMVQAARRRADIPRPLGPMEWRLHFFAWFDDPTYTADPAHVPISPELAEYFESIEAQAKTILTPGQRAWYALKLADLGQAVMRQEYPSTIDEAFEQSIEGAFFTREMSLLRKAGQIRRIPVAPGIPVHTFWDLGHRDRSALWFMQEVAGQFRFLRTYQASGEGLSHFVNEINKSGWIRGKFFLPHDAEQERLTADGGKSAIDYFREMNIPSTDLYIVPRTPLKSLAIEAARNVLPLVWMDPDGCAEGIVALDSYRKQWDDRQGIWRDEPVHDEFSHLADAFMQFAQGYRAGIGTRARLPVDGKAF